MMNDKQEIRIAALKAALRYRPVLEITLLLEVAKSFEDYIAGESTGFFDDDWENT